MENIRKESLQEFLDLKTLEITVQENAARQKEKLERQREESEKRNKEEAYRAQELACKQATFDLLHSYPFDLSKPISASGHWYDSDDGIGESIDTDWALVKEDEVIIFSKESARHDFGWATNKTKQDNAVWMFASDIEKPLIANAKRSEVLQYGMPIILGNFVSGNWENIKEEVESMKIDLMRKDLFERSISLLNQFGIHEKKGFTEDGIRIPGQSVRDIVTLRISDDGRAWRLVQRNDPFSGELEGYSLIYLNQDTQESFVINEHNVKPDVQPHMYISDTTYKRAYNKYVEPLKEGIELMENRLHPTLFDVGQA